MVLSVIRERIQEVVDFAKTESPYRSANKGWLTNNIFLERGSGTDQNAKKFDQVVKISVLWQPIVQIAFSLLCAIFLATLFAFTPFALAHGKLHLNIVSLNSTTQVQKTSIPTESKSLDLNTQEFSKEETINDVKTQSKIISSPTKQDKKEGESTTIFSPREKSNNVGLTLRF
ncbi:hypothetical protein [Prochlorococcus marinus]|uniref:hypothetical protein n=1 Tax=Prochlorococcus marinus TaxID=1219 RepID=UPI0022B5280B|nr:hypothetical protein [Prochlorococcus marinus]